MSKHDPIIHFRQCQRLADVGEGCPDCDWSLRAAPPGRQPPEPTEWEVFCPREGEFTVANGWRTFRTSFLGDAEWLRDRLRAASGGAPQEDSGTMTYLTEIGKRERAEGKVMRAEWFSGSRASGAAAPPAGTGERAKALEEAAQLLESLNRAVTR